MTIYERFAQFESEFLKFEKVEGKRTNRADLHAFIVLDELLPDARGRDIVSGAEHDQICLNIDLVDLDNKATDDHILELVRCGVFISSEYECLSMFV